MNKYFEVRYNFSSNEADVENGPSENDIEYEAYITESESAEEAEKNYERFAAQEGFSLYCQVIESTEENYNAYLEFQNELTHESLILYPYG
jgi:predicted DsbA family dithiol-disulfide isomerase